MMRGVWFVAMGDEATKAKQGGARGEKVKR